MITHSFAALVKFISWLFRQGSGSSYNGIPGGMKSDYLSYWGPRILITRGDDWHHLTGLFTVEMNYQDGKLVSCRPTLFSRKPGDKLFFGQKAYEEYHRICPPRPETGGVMVEG